MWVGVVWCALQYVGVCGSVVGVGHPGGGDGVISSHPQCQLSWQGKDMWPFLLPGLCHLTADDTPREVLLREQLHILLLSHFQDTTREFAEHRQAAVTLLLGHMTIAESPSPPSDPTHLAPN